MTKTDIDWNSPQIDWRYSGSVLGRQLGVSDQTVNHYRKKLKKPKSTITHFNPHPVEQ